MTAVALPTPASLSVAPRLDLRWLVLALLFMAVFAGFQGGRYYLANRLQELGIASALALYALGAWQGGGLYILEAANGGITYAPFHEAAPTLVEFLTNYETTAEMVSQLLAWMQEAQIGAMGLQ